MQEWVNLDAPKQKLSADVSLEEWWIPQVVSSVTVLYASLVYAPISKSLSLSLYTISDKAEDPSSLPICSVIQFLSTEHPVRNKKNKI